jgi:hypothetical protein
VKIVRAGKNGIRRSFKTEISGCLLQIQGLKTKKERIYNGGAGGGGRTHKDFSGGF